MNQSVLPLYNGLLEHSKNNPISFHVPGHKNGLVFPAISTNVFKDLLEIDVTELRGLDDLHSADGIIKQAQDLLADLYNVSKSYFLVGGSTAGNISMILAACNPNDTVLVQRNSHKSIMHALRLANVRPVFLSPEHDEQSQVSTNVSYETVSRALKSIPDVKALILTTPNYYGMVSHDLAKTINLAHSYEIPVLVDEAHGAHFILGEPFPTSALQLGADIVVQSAHKTLPAMTMGSYLHFNSSRVDREKVEYYLQVIQSSSPSYPIMASLDLARYYLAHISEFDKAEIVDAIHDFRRELSTNPELTLVPTESDTYQADLLKIIVQSNSYHTGFELQKEFEKEHIYTELADPKNVLFVLPLAPVKQLGDIVYKINKALQHIYVQENSRHKPIMLNNKLNNRISKICRLDLTYDEMRKYKIFKTPLEKSEGKIAANSVIPYPPGVPVILPGETINRTHIDTLYLLKKSGAYFQNDRELWDMGIDVYKL